MFDDPEGELRRKIEILFDKLCPDFQEYVLQHLDLLLELQKNGYKLGFTVRRRPRRRGLVLPQSPPERSCSKILVFFISIPCSAKTIRIACSSSTLGGFMGRIKRRTSKKAAR